MPARLSSVCLSCLSASLTISRLSSVTNIYIYGNEQDLRDIVLGTPDSLDSLLLNVTQPASESLLRNCVWALSNMCRGKPQPAIETLSSALPVLLGLLSSQDNEVLVDTCWALSYLSDGDTDRIQLVMSAGVVGPLVNLLQHGDSNVVTPALRTLGNFVTGDDVQTQVWGGWVGQSGLGRMYRLDGYFQCLVNFVFFPSFLRTLNTTKNNKRRVFCFLKLKSAFFPPPLMTKIPHPPFLFFFLEREKQISLVRCSGSIFIGRTGTAHGFTLCLHLLTPSFWAKAQC